MNKITTALLGLLTLSAASHAEALPACGFNLQVYRTGGTYCNTEKYLGTMDSKCKCPNPNYRSSKTKKCWTTDAANSGIPVPIYSCM